MEKIFSEYIQLIIICLPRIPMVCNVFCQVLFILKTSSYNIWQTRTINQSLENENKFEILLTNTVEAQHDVVVKVGIFTVVCSRILSDLSDSECSKFYIHGIYLCLQNIRTLQNYFHLEGRRSMMFW